jgi:hypothetical protein
MISWYRDIWYSHSCIKSSSYRSWANFLIWNNMNCFHFFLLIDCFKDNIWVFTICRRIFIVEKLKTLFEIKLVVHRKWKVTHFTSNNSPLIRISWVSWSSFSFWINPHSDAADVYKAHRSRTFARAYKRILLQIFFLVW